MSHPLLDRAANLVEQARTLNDEFEDKSRMPAEVAHKIDELLTSASKLRDQVNREQKISEFDSYLSTPDRKGFDPMATGEIHSPVAEGKTDKAERATHAFWTFVKKGYAGMSAETKAALVEDSNGMNIVPHDFQGIVLQDTARDAVMRPLVFVRPTSSNKVDVGNLTVAGGGWGKLDTTTSQPDGLGTAPAAPQTIEVFDMLALVKLGRDELEDSPQDLEAIIAPEIARYFAQFEDDAIAIGTGTDRPKGLTVSTAITQNVTAAAVGVVTSDDIKKMKYAVPQWALRNAKFVGSGPAEQAVALLKDTTGNYIWQQSLQAGTPDRLDGYAWYRHDGLPTPGAAGAKTKAIFFGDFYAGYEIADRRQMTVQRLTERFADEGKVGLLFTKRVGGDVIRGKALAFYSV